MSTLQIPCHIHNSEILFFSFADKILAHIQLSFTFSSQLGSGGSGGIQWLGAGRKE
jgi:hypothetical protein